MKENIFTRNFKNKGIALAVCGAVYLNLMIISATLLNSVYIFEWMSRNSYCYTWVLALAMIVFDKTVLSYFVTFGTLIGTVIGEILGSFIRDLRMSGITPDMNVGEIHYRSLHQGVLIWLITLLVFIVVGIVLEIVCSKRGKHAA